MTGKEPVAVAVADVTGDGQPDLVVANAAANTVSVLIGHGDGRFDDRADFGTGPSPTSVVVADFDNDGQPDLVVTSSDASTVSLLRGTCVP